MEPNERGRIAWAWRSSLTAISMHVEPANAATSAKSSFTIPGTRKKGRTGITPKSTGLCG